MREYEEDRAHEGRMQLIEISVTGHPYPVTEIMPAGPLWGIYQTSCLCGLA